MHYNYIPNKDDGLTPSMRKPRQIYLAAPFFTELQLKEIVQVEGLLTQHGTTFFSPRLECRYKLDSPPIVARRAFWLNKFHIKSCHLIIALLSFPDAGASWELGYAEAFNKPRLGVTGNNKVGLNLMIGMTVHTIIPFSRFLDTLLRAKLKETDQEDIIRYLEKIEVNWKGDME